MTDPSQAQWVLNWEPVDEVAALAGGQGSVLCVRNRSTGILGALKTLHPTTTADAERRFRLQGEVAALQLLNGNWCPKILESNADRWQDDVPLFVVAEWVPGVQLGQYRAKTGDLDIDGALPPVIQLCRAVKACHDVSIHHRDIKPDNIILRDGDPLSPVLVDFGLAWHGHESRATLDFSTEAGQEIGNRFLRLPEFAPGASHRDPRSDATMLVGIALFLLTGRAPRVLRDEQNRSPEDALLLHFPVPVRSDHRWGALRRLLRQGFQQGIADRFQSVGDLEAALETVLSLSAKPANPRDAISRLGEILDTDPKRPERERRRAVEKALTAFQEAVLHACVPPLHPGSWSWREGPAPEQRHLVCAFSVPDQSATLELINSVQYVVGTYTASYWFPGQPPKTYYSGPASDLDALTQSAREIAPNVAVEAATRFGEMLPGLFGNPPVGA